MNILYVAPQPFYIDRGTPIDIKLTLDVLDQRAYTIDMVTYGEGRDLPYDHVTYHRIPHFEWMGHVKAGFSLKKVLYDLVMIGALVRLLRSKTYDLVYTVEEGVFFALVIKMLFGIPYVYDMDSSMSDQIVEKYPQLKFLGRVFLWFERVASRNAKAVVPVCDALGERAQEHGAEKVVLLYDIPIHAERNVDREEVEDLRASLGLDGLIAMYVGNLEGYQGIDLLLESFALVRQKDKNVHLVVIGGAADHIERYRWKAKNLNVSDHVHFIGPRPAEDIYGYLSQADILVSPRTKGSNTPMKIYSYMASGKPLLATRLWTHTQVLGGEEACLADPTPEAYAEGLRRLAKSAVLRKELGEAGQRLIAMKHNHKRYVETFAACLDWLEKEVDGRPSSLETTL